MALNEADRASIRLSLLVLRCQAGEERAFTQLFELHGAQTLRYLRTMLRDDTDADDAQQELWLTVYRQVATLSNPRAFRTWLYRATRHRAIDVLRRRRRESELLAEDDPEVVGNELAGVEYIDVDVPEIDQLLQSLPPPQREVLLLRYRDDMSYEEIAMITAVPIGTVRTRLHHAKRKLQELLQRERAMTTERDQKPTDRAWSAIERERLRDRTIRRICIAAWTSTVVLLLVFASFIAIPVWQAFRAAVEGHLPWITVVGSAMPFFGALWTLSLLVAALSTAAMFIRMRTTSLSELQLRLAALEELISSGSK